MQREGVHPCGDCPNQVWEDHRQGRAQKDITIAKNYFNFRKYVSISMTS